MSEIGTLERIPKVNNAVLPNYITFGKHCMIQLWLQYTKLNIKHYWTTLRKQKFTSDINFIMLTSNVSIKVGPCERSPVPNLLQFVSSLLLLLSPGHPSHGSLSLHQRKTFGFVLEMKARDCHCIQISSNPCISFGPSREAFPRKSQIVA